MITSDSTNIPGAILASKHFKPGQTTPSSTRSLSRSNGKANISSKPRASFDGTKCSHCGNLKRTRENCFKLHGYPDWWNELQARKCRDVTGSNGGTGQATVATIEPRLSLSSHVETSQGNVSTIDLGKCNTTPCSSS
jgi:hypothetical protein